MPGLAGPSRPVPCGERKAGRETGAGGRGRPQAQAAAACRRLEVLRTGHPYASKKRAVRTEPPSRLGSSSGSRPPELCVQAPHGYGAGPWAAVPPSTSRLLNRFRRNGRSARCGLPPGQGRVPLSADPKNRGRSPGSGMPGRLLCGCGAGGPTSGRRPSAQPASPWGDPGQVGGRGAGDVESDGPTSWARRGPPFPASQTVALTPYGVLPVKGPEPRRGRGGGPVRG